MRAQRCWMHSFTNGNDEMNSSPITRSGWASLPTDTPVDDFVHAIRSGLPVHTIATPRHGLITAPSGSAPESVCGGRYEAFDFVPAVDGTEIVGAFAKSVHGRVFEPLRESVLVEADSSLLDFIGHADSRPYAFLISERKIIGFATHADLQKMPVYTAIFAVASAVEMLLIRWIRLKVNGDDEAWLQFVEKDRKQIEKFYKESEEGNVALDRLSCANLSQEVEAARGLRLIDAGSLWDDKLESLIALRNQVCHCKEIALNECRVKVLSRTVRGALEVALFLSERLKGLST